jgi:hypothetical protein
MMESKIKKYQVMYWAGVAFAIKRALAKAEQDRCLEAQARLTKEYALVQRLTTTQNLAKGIWLTDFFGPANNPKPAA